MPGRGQPWKLGKGNPDRIGTKAIADGSITEADLDSSLTVKVNSGGHVIKDEGGVALPQRGNLDFVGAGVTASDGIEDTTTVTIVGGGGIARELIANPFTDFWFYDEFFYLTPTTALDLYYDKNGTFSGVTSAEGGVTEINTTTSIDDTGDIVHSGSIDVTKNFRFVASVKKGQTDTVSAYRIGLFTSSMGSAPGGTFPYSVEEPPNLLFEADGTGNWFATTDDGSTPQSTDTGVADDGVFHTFEIRSDPTAPNIEFLIDDVIVATFTTNLPTGLLKSYVGVQTNVTSSKTISIDSLFMYQDR